MKKIAQIIIGIDPGLQTTGFAVLEKTEKGLESRDYGVFLTDSKTAFPLRLREIASDFDAILAKWKPQILGIEKLVFVKNVTNGLLVAQVRGILIERAVAAGMNVVEVAPTEVKKHVTGNGQAPKSQIQRMVQMLLHLQELPKPDDAADALAIALTAVGRNKEFL